MVRFFRIMIHLSVFAAGIAALANTDFFSWDLPQGLLLPMVGTAFLVYLIVFMLTKSYRDFVPGPSKTKRAPEI